MIQAVANALDMRPCYLLLAVLLLAGCHSACFQTAKIRNGTDAAVGITWIDAADNPAISDYSIFIRGAVGRAARTTDFGYSFAVTAVAPLKNKHRNVFTSAERDIEVFPNEWAGVLPEFKLQIPRILPVDVAIDFRLMGYVPERVALLTSYDVARVVTLYGSWSYNLAVAPQMCVGIRYDLSSRSSLLIEYSAWLSDHDYPDDFSGSALKRPYSVGMALSHHWPRPPKDHDHREFAKAPPMGSGLEIGRSQTLTRRNSR